MNKNIFRGWLISLLFVGYALAQHQAITFQKPKVIAHAEWEAFPRLGFPAVGIRRNIAPGELLNFMGLKLEFLAMDVCLVENKKTENYATLRLIKNSKSEIIKLKEGSALNWNGFHIAILAIHAHKGELGAGLTEFEVCKKDSMPKKYAQDLIAGDASYRAWIPQKIKMITLHHSNDPKSMTFQNDPIKYLQKLQAWGRTYKNWWDVPYHFLIAPDGTIYEGRDYRYMGETNTAYNPMGHLLICCIGNYDIQEPSSDLLKSISDLMAWAVSEYAISFDHIYGHYQLTSGVKCPGKHLKKCLEDGVFEREIQARLQKEASN